MDQETLVAALGGMDIMLLDQLLRGRIAPGARVFDAGCGAGRNLRWFLAQGHPVQGCDSDPTAVAACRELCAGLRPDLPIATIRCASLEDESFPAASADLVICNAVLHFASGPLQAERLVAALWRLLAPDGLLFVRLASRIGLPADVRPPGFTFLADLDWLLAQSAMLGGTLADPIKTSNVQDRRCMSTWVLRKA